jgi:hypothetical protein
MSSNLVEAARKEGVRVHTVGVDRVSADFYYFADGGAAESVRVQGNLVEMLADHVDSTTTNAEIEALQASLINRLLSALSDGIVSELEVELADAMPRLSRDGTGLVGTDLERFEAQAAALAAGSTRFEAAARKLAEALATATHAGQTRARVPLYGEAQREKMPPLEVRVGDRPLRLPECFLWTVSGTPHEEARVEAAKPAPRPVAGPAPVRDRAAAQPEVVAPQPTKPEVAAPVRAKSEVIAPVQAKSEVVAPQSVPPAASEAAKAAVVPAATPKGEVKAPPAGTRAPTSPAAAKPSALVPVFLLLGLAASLYFLWRSLPW